MEFLNKIREKVQDLEEKDFYTYLIVFFSIVTIVIFVIILVYYLKVGSLQESLDEINDLRETDVKNLLIRDDRVKKQRQQVNSLLKKEPDFKILEYYQDLLKELNLDSYSQIATPKSKKANDNYRESELVAKLVGMNSEQLCRLLQALENNERINIKSLMIEQSSKKRNGNAIDVSLIIATLQPLKEKAT